MANRFDHPAVADGDLVLAKDMREALTAAPLVFSDGAKQRFTPDGKTTYVEHGHPSEGEWAVLTDGEFSSFWPPDYSARYALRWIVENGKVTGLSFTELERGDRFVGVYE
jgi:hypothetical protein